MRRKRANLNGLAKEPSQDPGYKYVGAKIQKDFEGYGVFSGIITTFDPQEQLWLVEYEDGDGEELDEAGVIAHMLGVPQPAPPPARAAVPANKHQKKRAVATVPEPAGSQAEIKHPLQMNGATTESSPCPKKPSGEGGKYREKTVSSRRCVPTTCPFYKQLVQEQEVLLAAQERSKELEQSLKRQRTGSKGECTCHHDNKAMLVERREFAEPIKRNIQVTVTADGEKEQARQKAVLKELKRLSTFNSLSGPLISVTPEVVAPLVFESIPGLLLFQGLLLGSVDNGVRLLEEIKHDSTDLSDLVNGKYRRYACSNSENDTNQLRVYFASDQTRNDDRTCQEIRRGAPPEVSMPDWTTKLHNLIQQAVFPFLRDDLRKMEEEERQAVINACRAKHKAIPPHVMKPSVSEDDPSLFHHTMVHYKGNLGSHFDPVWLGHIIIASSLEPADIVMVHPVRNVSQRLRLFSGDVYVLMGEARDDWAHEVQLWGQSEQRSSIVTRYWRPGHAFQERKFDSIENSYWKDLRGAGHGDLR
eukprot:TRINITY_DN3886_c0_g1_i5.p1 TRINITY_DN3886_c0_g1~~TRINITY_DN3886_c0_g1_i5.p1  ORF type:complete len:530 (+),score=90.75 TRINITY_DN3886_c0_g1_i5:232-1821(+)